MEYIKLQKKVIIKNTKYRNWFDTKTITKMYNDNILTMLYLKTKGYNTLLIHHQLLLILKSL